MDSLTKNPDNPEYKPWRSWEYRVLNENLSSEKTACLLKRAEAEVDWKTKRICESTFEGWYRRHHCYGSPENPRGLVALAYKVWNEDFAEILPQEELQNQIIFTLQHCFYYFDTLKGNQTAPVAQRFVKYFVFWFRRRLRKRRNTDTRWLQRHSPITQTIAGTLVEPQKTYAKAAEYERWCRFLFSRALSRFDRQTRSLIRMRYIDGLQITQLVNQTGLSTRSITRKTSRNVVVRLFQNEVQKMVISIPDVNLEKIVFYLHYENEFTECEVARLFCITQSRVQQILMGAAGRILAGLDNDAAMGLFTASVEQDSLGDNLEISSRWQADSYVN